MSDWQRAVESPLALGVDELAALLSSRDDALWREIYAAAREVKARCGKRETLRRGLIECSNRCAKNCSYCGIRSGNREVRRYRLEDPTLAALVAEVRRRGYGAIAFQAGELESEENTRYYERLLAMCGGLEVTLSLGEQHESVYRRWREAGALRYLIRIETANRELYRAIHPAECSFERRQECIRTLKRLGYVTGTGVMIGLPGQTVRDLARDLAFFGEERVDMVGMGPYVPHPAAPLDGDIPDDSTRLELSLRMIALARLHLHRVNIVAATALEVLAADGRQRGLDAGANVIMPTMTPPDASVAYDLYPGKHRRESRT